MSGEPQVGRCETCFWFDTSITCDDGTKSPCRVNPPALPIGQRDGWWPMVEDVDWCGRYQEDPQKMGG